MPAASPWSLGRPAASYTDPQGRGIYGAATWGDAAPPPEYALIRDVPAGRSVLAERIWHPGLARDWSLAQRNVVSFRIELTTAIAAGGCTEQFRASGRAMLAAIALIGNWRPVFAAPD